MIWGENEKAYVREHLADDTARLLLGAKREPGLDVPFLVEQIESRRQIREKLPSWYANEELVFPAKIAAEQCSSEQTALYKQRLVGIGDRLCDLTGGLGIDSYFFSRKVREVVYVERFPVYCEVARHNFQALGATNITVVNADATQCLGQLPEVDVFYIDPARRGSGNRRVYALSDCEPDLPALLPVLWGNAPRVIAKLSPMADISQTRALLPGTVAIHVIAVRNECKELLFEVQRGSEEEPLIHCVHFTAHGEEDFSFTQAEERDAPLRLASAVGNYLYEPNAALLKAGAFKTIAVRLEVEKLHVSSHLYTSKELVKDFPGRSFRVEQVVPFSSKIGRTLHREIPRANIAVRNFPLSVEELRKRTKIAEGGDLYLFATTLRDGEKVLIVGRKPA